MIKNNEETKENRAELRSETTIKVKHYKESVRKFSPTVITSIEALNSYFKKDNFDDKSQKIQIFDIPSNETAERFEKYEAFPLELKDIELIFYSDFYKDPSDINSILKNILKKKSALEVFRLSIVDTHKNLDSIEFQLINSLKKLKTLKINLGLNVLGHKTQKIVLKALEGHPDLRALSLSLNNCDLKDDFLNSLTHRCFFELQLQSKLKKFKLNLSNNKFLFNSTIEVIWLRKLFASFNVIEVIDLNFSMNEHLNKIFDMVIQALKLVLFGLVTLREFKLNLFYCKLSHDNIENLCEILAKMNERLNIKLDLREDSDHEIQIKTIKVIEGMISLYKAVPNSKIFNIYY